MTDRWRTRLEEGQRLVSDLRRKGRFTTVPGKQGRVIDHGAGGCVVEWRGEQGRRSQVSISNGTVVTGGWV